MVARAVPDLAVSVVLADEAAMPPPSATAATAVPVARGVAVGAARVVPEARVDQLPATAATAVPVATAPADLLVPMERVVPRREPMVRPAVTAVAAEGVATEATAAQQSPG
jgi:hypothetical protein